MIDCLRKKVSGHKIRLDECGYSLDLTYITQRIIASAFPASGVKTIWRDSIKTFGRFLEQKHKDKFRVFNISGFTYDKTIFNDQVIEFLNWKDHHAPTFDMLLKIVLEIESWLALHPENVAMIHCLAGKGRTGTTICCYLLKSKTVENPEEAFLLFAGRRFKDLSGVNQPSQVRYVQYF